MATGGYSLSHVALPFDEKDMVYGVGASKGVAHLTLGRLEPRGEKGLLNVSKSDLMRLRYNPFFSYLAEQVEKWAMAIEKSKPMQLRGQTPG